MLDYVFEMLMDHVSLMKSLGFNLMLLSAFLLYTFYDIPYVNVPEMAAARLGISEREVMTLL